MVKLDKEQLIKLSIMLASDESFASIKRELGLSKNYNIKNLCDYYGKKYIRLYESHINVLKENNSLIVPRNEDLKELIFKGFNSVADLINRNQNNLIESKDIKNNTVPGNEYVIEKLPEQLPLEIQKYKSFDKITIRVQGEINEKFKNFIKENGTFKSAEFYSLALWEFLKKYKGN